MGSKGLIGRRTLLRGAGAAVALPMLDSMLPARAWAQSASPPRLLVVRYPLGYHPDSWQTTGTGTGYTASPQLANLVAANRSEIMIVKGLHTHLGITADSAPNLPDLNYFSFGVSHYQGTAGFLTCVPTVRGTSYPVSVGTSFDQLIAQTSLGTQTPLRSLVLRSVENVAGSDSTYGEAKAYRTNISWANPTTPATSVDDPVSLFSKLFGTGIPATGNAAAQRKAFLQVSVLDAIRDDAQRLNGRLGVSDQRRLDEYLTSLQEVERRLKALPPATTCATPPPPGGAYSYPDHVIDRMVAMFDLLILAFSCDLTRVASYMLDEDFQPFNTASLIPNTLTYPHALSHYADSSGVDASLKPAQLKMYNQLYFDQFSNFLDKLKVIQTPTGRLIDQMLIAYGSGMGDSMLHSGYDVPVILAGKGNGALKPGKLLDVRTGAFAALENIRPWDPSFGTRPKGRPVADLWLSFMRAMALPDASFGNSTGPIAELVA